MKKRIIIWGGNGRPLTIENLDSHASVTAFFLTKYLARYYEIINLTDVDTPEKILRYNRIDAVISTFQRGFTNRLIMKSKHDVFQAIRLHVKGLLCSVYDYNYNDTRYYEDVIFTVREPSEENAKKIKKKSLNPNMRFVRMGWCADPEFCYPNPFVPQSEINVFIDHPPYSSGARDCTKTYHNVLYNIKKKYPNINLHAYQQNNHGIVQLDLSLPYQNDPSLYERSQKVPWIDIVQYYKRMHIFCITTPQSACLSAIEAAMCGAKLYIPKYWINRYFIPDDLLDGRLSFSTFRCTFSAITVAFLHDIHTGFSREIPHQTFLPHTWQHAADIIYKELSRE